MFDRTAIAWAICRAATPENLQELSNYGNAGPIADAVISAILEGMHADGVSNKPLNPAALATPPAPNDDLRAALEWYAERVADCRKITPEGDNARQALDLDGGKRARAALKENRRG